MAKPTDIPTWATGPGETIVDPGPTRTQTGFVAGKKAPAGWFNFLFNRQGAWFSYLNDLHNEAQFLNKTYTWTGLQAFNGTARFGTNPQIAGTTNDLVYTNAGGTVTQRDRTILLPMTRFQSRSPEWFFGGFAGIEGDIWATNGLVTPTYPLTPLVAQFQIPTGAVLKSATVGLTEVSAGTCGVHLGYDVPESLSGVSQSVTASATGSHTVSMVAPDPHDSATMLCKLWLVVTAGHWSMQWAKVTFGDPGPRNY